MLANLALICAAHAGADIQIGISPNLGSGVSRSRYFKVAVKNVTARTIYLYELGSSWGDPTIWFELTDSKGKRAEVHNGTMAYFRNAPWTYALKPRESKSMNISLSAPAWSEPVRKALASLSAPIQIRPFLEEHGPMPAFSTHPKQNSGTAK